MSDRVTLSITRRMASAVALVFAITSVFGLAAPSPAAAWSSGSFSAASESQLVALTNQSRAAAGRKALKVDSTLRSIARWRSKDMIQRDYFSHDIPGGGRVFDVMSDRGYCFHVAGENIGWNNASDAGATQRIHNMFMGSSGHRANILGKDWDVIGIGAYKGANGKKMWTVIFADRCGSTAPKPKPKPNPPAKPKPTVHPVQRATPKPTRKPAPEPATLTASPSPTILVSPIFPPVSTVAPATPEPAASPAPSTAPDASLDLGGDHGLRVVASRDQPGLLEAIVGDVTRFLLGS